MITTLKSLQNKFADASFKEQFEQDAGVSLPDDVTSLGSNLLTIYYRALQKFLNENHRRYPMYVRIPFSEVSFEINTESREIVVPKVFAQNGVGVVGDHLAEFLWFSVDRFYDMTDLMTCNIDITWHNTAAANAFGDEVYNTIPFGKYCDSEKIYFGWYISKNASLVAGTIEFAIRFYRQQTSDQGLNYLEFELNTLPAKITIKNGMNIDSATVATIDNFEDIVKSRAIYSEIVNSLSAAEPVLNPPLVGGSYDVDPDTNTITFTIGAYSPDNIVRNVPAEYDELGNPVEDEQGNIITVPEMVQHNADIVYSWYWNNKLISNDGSTIDFPQSALTAEKNVSITTAEDGSTSTLVTNVPGKYNVYVGNKIINENADNYGAIRYVVSNVVELKEATQIELASNNDPRYMYIEDRDSMLHLDVDWTTVNGAADYQWFKDNIALADREVCTEEDNLDYHPTARGVYYGKVRNVKNLMITEAQTNPVNVLNVPRRVLDSDITLTQEGSNVIIGIANGYDDSEYHYRATIQPITGNTQTSLSLGDGEYHIGPSHAISLAGRGFAPGQYLIVVKVSEITCRGISGYQRQYMENGQVAEGARAITVEIE